MKEYTLLIWLTQLGLSVAMPPVLLILLADWLRKAYGWGSWVIWAAIILGVILAIDGLRTSLKLMARLGEGKKKDNQQPVSYNDHT